MTGGGRGRDSGERGSDGRYPRTGSQPAAGPRRRPRRSTSAAGGAAARSTRSAGRPSARPAARARQRRPAPRRGEWSPAGELHAQAREWSARVKFAAVIVSVLVFCLTGMVWAQYRQLAGLGSSHALFPGSESADGGTNILLIGLDSRKDQNGLDLPPDVLAKLHAGDGQEGGYNTNTLILMHVPPDGRQAVAFSIPRDDAVDIPGEHRDKIKKAYGYAKAKAEESLRGQGMTDQHEIETQSREAGRRATIQVVQDLTGVHVDHFAEVNLAGFYDLATALGGVEVCLNQPAHDDYSGADFPAGRQTLDGAQALAFVRQRHNLIGGDLDRTRRQQAFLSSVAHKLREAGTFTDTAKLQHLIDVAKQDVVLDAGWDVLNFAEQAQNLTGGNLRFDTLPITGFGRIDDQDVNLIDPDAIRTIVRTAFGEQAPPPPPPPLPPLSALPPPSSTVDVLNGSGITGLAASVADRLVQQGFQRGDVRNASNRNDSAVHYGGGAKPDAQRVAVDFGGLPITADDTLPPNRVQVLLGGSFTFPAEGAATNAPPPPPPAPATPAPSSAPPANDIPCVN